MKRKDMLKKKVKEKGTQFRVLTPQGVVEKAMTIDLASVKSPDPLAYAYGFFQGKQGLPMAKAKKGDKLAPEYIRGFKEGRKARGK